MPNGEHIQGETPEVGGRRVSDYYVYAFCKQQHEKIDKRLDRIDGPSGSISNLYDKMDTVQSGLTTKIDAEYQRLDSKYNRIMWFLISILFSIVGSGAYIGYYIGANM